MKPGELEKIDWQVITAVSLSLTRDQLPVICHRQHTVFTYL